MIDSATYSPEDNKIRLYPSARLDSETFTRVKEAGFKWAPKQELFVAPKWTPEREDLAIDLSGADLEPEQMTLAERAQIKAERLEGLAVKRHNEANAFHAAADELSKTFEGGQPILIGHHSQRKAEKTKERMTNAMDKAVKASKLSNYWLYRASGVEHHANYKNLDRTRDRRIKTLLTDLRAIQSAFNDDQKAFTLWSNTSPDDFNRVSMLANHSVAVPYGTWSDLQDGKTTPQEVHAGAIERATRGINSTRRARFIAHILNRLAYERDLLGPVARFDGDLTPAILQTFARTHGADKPQARLIEGEQWEIACKVPLPAHIGKGQNSIELSSDDWRELMQSVGYEVPAAKPKAPPILNFKCETITAPNRYNRGQTITYKQIELTKEEYSKVWKDSRGTQISICGQFKFKICVNPKHDGPRYQAGFVAVFLTDSKVHPKPESVAIDAPQTEVA